MKSFNPWSSLAQSANSANSGNSTKNKESIDSFQQFKRVAKDKSDRQKQILEQQKQQNAEKERQEKERKEKQEKEALARKSMGMNVISAGGLTDHDTNSPLGSISPASGSSSPAQNALDRDIQRKREQERRRREAMAGQIDMNRQSDIMNKFEETL